MYDTLELMRLGISKTEASDTFYEDTKSGVAAGPIGAGRIGAARIAYGEPPGPVEEVLRRRMRPLSHQYEAWHRQAKVPETAARDVLTASQWDAVSSMPSARNKEDDISLTEAGIYLYDDTSTTRLGVLTTMEKIAETARLNTTIEVTDARLMSPGELAKLV